MLSVPLQVIAWRTVSEMTYNVSSRTLNLTHPLSLSLMLQYCAVSQKIDNVRDVFDVLCSF